MLGVDEPSGFLGRPFAPSAPGGLNRDLHPAETGTMNITIRRYESIDQSRKSELVKKIDDGLLPTLSELPGFHGYSLVDAGDGVMTSVGFFDTAAQADESTRVATSWLREQKLESALPNAPKITSGAVVVHKTRELVQA